MATPGAVSFPLPRYIVKQLKEGYHNIKQHEVRACGSVTLITGPHTMLVGTGMAQEKDVIIQGIKENGLTPDEIEYVVCTHGHIENVGNLNLFPNAIHIVGQSIAKRDHFFMHDFNEGIPYEIDEDLVVTPSPGHVPPAVSVLVANTALGTIAVAGGAFYSSDDLETPDLWQECSLDPETQQQSRIEILKVADYIIPRYGPLFCIPDEYKRSEMKVVMTP